MRCDIVLTSRTPGQETPWQKYRSVIEVAIDTDIIAAISLNRGSRLLPTYRKLLSRMDGLTTPEQYISMLDVMGCDNTTVSPAQHLSGTRAHGQLLAIAETTALSEWRDRAEEMGSLSQRALVKRGEAIEKLLSERSWRNSGDMMATIEQLGADGTAIPDERTKTRLMAEVYFAAAKVYLYTVINGPFPKGPSAPWLFTPAPADRCSARGRGGRQRVYSRLQSHRRAIPSPRHIS
jgi:hypothetical protein